MVLEVDSMDNKMLSGLLILNVKKQYKKELDKPWHGQLKEQIKLWWSAIFCAKNEIVP